MAVVHPLRALRDAIVGVLTDAAISVATDDGMTPVIIRSHPPAGGLIPEAQLPGVYVYPRSELRERETNTSDAQAVLYDIVLQAKSSDETALDQVDAMHLAVEVAMQADETLGGLCYSQRVTGSETMAEQGEITFAARRVTYEIERDLSHATVGVTV